MSLKRILLALMTVVVVTLMTGQLLTSLTEPQVQGQISLYQTNLLLEAQAWPALKTYPQAQSLFGENPATEARRSYAKVIESLQAQPELSPIQTQQLAQAQLNYGILLASTDPPNLDLAIQAWDEMGHQNPNLMGLGQTLTQLWQTPPKISPTATSEIEQHLQGWFRTQALQHLWQLENNDSQLAQLEPLIARAGKTAFIRLALISVMPLVGSVIGIVLLLAWGINQYRNQPQANLDVSVAWNSETTLAVMVAWFTAFFAISFIVMPLLVELVGGRTMLTTPLSQALYALVTYSLMMLAGFGIIGLGVRSTGEKGLAWLGFKPKSRWWAWGLGAYFVALPLVLVVSLFSQQLLQNQGGGNPLLDIILSSRDYPSFAILWFMVAVLAPIFEETLFRGFLLPALLPQMRPVTAMVISGGLFALAHLNAADVLPLAVLGTILAYVYWRSGNLWAAMLLHGIWNSGSFIGLLLLSP